METRSKPQAMQSSFAPRLRIYNNSLLTPVLPTAPSGPISRTTKRGTTIINYAEDGYDEIDDDDENSRRRPTGLRSLRREETSAANLELLDKVGKEASGPVDVPGINRHWMTPPRYWRNDQQSAAQAQLPLTLIPIRIDVDIPAFTPMAQWPRPEDADPSLPQFLPGEMTLPYRLRDIFLWNLHETVVTTDYFASRLVQELDLPHKPQMTAEISKQIRTQLEEYAGVALHPLFHSQPQNQTTVAADTPKPSAPSRDDSPTPAATPGARIISRADTPMQNGGVATPSKLRNVTSAPDVTAEATPITPSSDEYNPDDMYRCIVNLNINLASTLYTDRFEWSLLHPPGTAEAFAKQTCADLGLAGEWVPAMAHAIYEAVLRIKKEACEAGGLVGGWNAQTELANDAAHGAEAGWRYDPEHLAEEWEPKVEQLTKEDMEKREGDRERQIRRLRRETARFSSTTGMVGGVPFSGFGSVVDTEEERMGRGERSKKKKRFRSLSPLRSGTPGGRGTPDVGAGYGGGGGGVLTEQERVVWKCAHCLMPGTSVWAVRDGPAGPRVSPSFHSFNNPLLTCLTVLVQQLWSPVRERSPAADGHEIHA